MADDQQNSSNLDRYLQRQENSGANANGPAPAESAASSSQPPNLNLNISSTPQIQTEPAGFWRRVAANILDGIIVSVVTTPTSIALPLIFAATMGDMGSILSMFVTYPLYFIVAYFYFGWFYSQKGATPGKMVMGLKVLNADNGTHISYWRAFGRETIGKWISAMVLMIGYLMVAFRGDKKALHDLMFNTQVVHVKK